VKPALIDFVDNGAMQMFYQESLSVDLARANPKRIPDSVCAAGLAYRVQYP
jgi:hypothetical protein